MSVPSNEKRRDASLGMHLSHIAVSRLSAIHALSSRLVAAQRTHLDERPQRFPSRIKTIPRPRLHLMPDLGLRINKRMIRHQISNLLFDGIREGGVGIAHVCKAGAATRRRDDVGAEDRGFGGDGHVGAWNNARAGRGRVGFEFWMQVERVAQTENKSI